MNKTARNILKLISVVILLGVIAFIWHNSMDEADVSTEKSLGITESVNTFLFGEGNLVISEHFVRKCAHLSEYMLEGISLTLVMVCFIVSFSKKHILLFFAGGVVTAIADELIQKFSTGRSSQISDVCIDSVGVAIGLFLGLFVFQVFYRKAMKNIHRE